MPTMPRVVLDTNVWLDWLVFNDPAIAPLRALVEADRAQIYLDALCAAELERALSYDLKREVDVTACMAKARRAAYASEATVPSAQVAKLPHCRDPDDQKFLEAALASRADFLITKDHALLALDGRAAFRIVTPAGFAAAT